jgi:hypothetical protein
MEKAVAYMHASSILATYRLQQRRHDQVILTPGDILGSIESTPR